MKPLALLLLLPLSAFAASVAIEGPTVMQSGNTIVKTFPAPGAAACKAEVEKLNAGLKRYCRTQYDTKALPVVPVNCVVSAPVETAGAWSACAAGTRTRTITATRTVTTQPANGGQACPVLVTTRVESEACSVVPPATWTRAAGEDATFTLYAPAQVRYGAGSTWTAPRNLPAGPVACTNAVFTDPIEGTLKECQVSPASALTAPPQPPPTPAVGTASLTWTAPTQNTDGTPLTNLAGHLIYRGTSAANLAQVAQVTATSYNFTALPSGTHYFAVSAYSTAGIESALSAVGSKTIP